MAPGPWNSIGMTSPIVTEMVISLEPVEHDDFGDEFESTSRSAAASNAQREPAVSSPPHRPPEDLRLGTRARRPRVFL
jgi:hypothetical protein